MVKIKIHYMLYAICYAYTRIILINLKALNFLLFICREIHI